MPIKFEYATTLQPFEKVVKKQVADELLEALQLAFADMTGGMKSCGHNGYTCTCSYEKAKAAIRKAMGE